MHVKNPYMTGNPVGNSPTFVGRTDILREVRRVIHSPQQNAIVLYGQRRIGKTSILQELEAKLSQQGAYQPVFFDFQDKVQWPLEQVLEALAQQISDRLGQTTPNLGQNPKLTFSKWLSEILNTLPTDILVLLFDEFDVLADYESEQAGVVSYLRDLLTTYSERLKSVLVIGRTTKDLTHTTLSFFKNIAKQKVSLLNHDDTVKLICLSNNNGLNWSNDTIEKVWQLTNGHPYLTQSLCSSIWERLYSQRPNEPPTVALKDVEEAVPDVLIFSDHVLEWLWNGLPAAERVVASALADADAKAITEMELERRLSNSGVQRVIRELDNAPRLLQDWDIIKATDNQGYRFRVELVRRWIAEYKPFYQEQQKLLNRVDPKADTLYKKAQELYDERYLEEALRLLESSVQSNPYHVRANQLLSDILLEQKKYHEARKILEKLYSYQSVAARFRLIQVLLALAKSSPHENEQLKLYERILELDAGHPEANNQLNNIRQRYQTLRYAKLLIKHTKHFFTELFTVKHKKLAIWLGIIISLIALLIPYFPDGYTYLRCLQGSNSESGYRFEPWKTEFNKIKAEYQRQFAEATRQTKKVENDLKKTRQILKKTKNDISQVYDKVNNLMSEAIGKGGNVTNIAKPYLVILTELDRIRKAIEENIGKLEKQQNFSSDSKIYVTHLTFMDADTKTIMVQTKVSELINKAIIDGMQLAKNANSNLEINRLEHKLDNTDANVNKLVNIFWDVNLTKGEKIQKIITEMMEPNKIYAIVTGQYLEKKGDIINVRPFVVSKYKKQIVSKNHIFDNKQFLCVDPNNSSVKILCQPAHEKIRDSVKELLETL